MCTSFKSNVSYALNSWPQHKAEMTPSEIELHIVIIHPTSTSKLGWRISIQIWLCNYFLDLSEASRDRGQNIVEEREDDGGTGGGNMMILIMSWEKV